MFCNFLKFWLFSEIKLIGFEFWQTFHLFLIIIAGQKFFYENPSLSSNLSQDPLSNLKLPLLTAPFFSRAKTFFFLTKKDPLKLSEHAVLHFWKIPTHFEGRRRARIGKLFTHIRNDILWLCMHLPLINCFLKAHFFTNCFYCFIS